MGFKTYFEAHVPMFEELKLVDWIFRRLIKLNQFAKLVVISKKLKRIFFQNYPLKSVSVIVAHDGADEIKDFQKLEIWPGRKDVFQIGYTGHLYSGRGIELILKLANYFQNYDFHIAGGNEKELY